MGDGTITKGLTAKHKMDLVVQAIKKYTPKSKPTIVEFGGVYGSMEILKKELGAEVFSVNVTEEQLIDCEKKILADITSDIPLPDNTADVIICLDTFEHLIEPDKALQNAKRILKENGLLVITKPNLASLPNRISLLFGYMPTNYCPAEKRYGCLFGEKNSSWHKTVLTQIGLKRFLEDYGFKVKQTTGYSYSYNKIIQLINSALPTSMREGLCMAAVKQSIVE